MTSTSTKHPYLGHSTCIGLMEHLSNLAIANRQASDSAIDATSDVVESIDGNVSNSRSGITDPDPDQLPPLLRLPAEIRNLIYIYALPTTLPRADLVVLPASTPYTRDPTTYDYTYNYIHTSKSRLNPLLRTCRQSYTDLLPRHHASHTHLHLGLDHTQFTFPTASKPVSLANHKHMLTTLRLAPYSSLINYLRNDVPASYLLNIHTVHMTLSSGQFPLNELRRVLPSLEFIELVWPCLLDRFEVRTCLELWERSIVQKGLRRLMGTCQDKGGRQPEPLLFDLVTFVVARVFWCTWYLSGSETKTFHFVLMRVTVSRSSRQVMDYWWEKGPFEHKSLRTPRIRSGTECPMDLPCACDLARNVKLYLERGW